jgi:predicted nuclease of predicted toxin-antitoxin system
MSFLRGAPPKVIWVDVGNCSTNHIQDVIRANAVRIIAFHRDVDSAFLILP